MYWVVFKGLLVIKMGKRKYYVYVLNKKCLMLENGMGCLDSKGEWMWVFLIGVWWI